MKSIFNFTSANIFKKNNIILLFFLIVCFFSRLNSKIYLIDIISQFGFQIFIVGILLFFIFLFFRKILLSLTCILICFLLLADILLSCNHCNAFLKDKFQNHNKIRLMTFNIGLINNFKNIHEQILLESPEIIQLQEVSPKVQSELKSLKSLFPYIAGLDKPLGHFSSIVLSKYPLKNTKVIGDYAVLTKVILPDTELNIIGLHLPAPLNQFLLNLYVDFYFSNSNATKPTPLPHVNFDVILKQMDHIKNLVNKNNKNIILMGDLNMTITSKRFTNFLHDANLYTYVSYKHPTFTWPTRVPYYLGIQIDHVLFSKNFKVIEKKTGNHVGSDHRPLIVDLAF